MRKDGEHRGDSMTPFKLVELTYPSRPGVLLANQLLIKALDTNINYLADKTGRLPDTFLKADFSQKLLFATSFTVSVKRYEGILTEVNLDPEKKYEAVSWKDLVDLFAKYYDCDARFVQALIGEYPKKELITHREGDAKVHPGEFKIHANERIMGFIFVATGHAGDLNDGNIPNRIAKLRQEVKEKRDKEKESKRTTINRLVNFLRGDRKN